MIKAKSLLVMSLLLLLFPILVSAQTTSNSSAVTGTVTDPTGAIIPGATVTLIDTRTGQERTATTNDQGVYQFNQVPPGQGYKLTFTNQGFQTLTITDIALGVGKTETHNAQLVAGQVTEQVTVTSGGEATLNTTDASIGNVIDERRLRELPIQIRSSPAALIGLQPGVVGNNVGTTTSNRVGSVTGSRADQGNITVDGIDANDQATGQFASTVGNAPIDAIQEFRAVSTNPNAAEGRSSGGQVELITKSGTNDFSGNARWYNRTTATAANTWFNNAAGVFGPNDPQVLQGLKQAGQQRAPRPKLTRNQFGGSLGGPIKRDKLFFFQDYEGRRDASEIAYTRIVPLQHFRAGGLAFLNNTAGCPTNARLVGPGARPECITVLTPAQVAALDPRGIGANAALLQLFNDRFPLPNDLSLGNGINTAGLRFNAPTSRKDNTTTTRIDWNATDRQKIFGRFNIARRIQTDTVNTVAQQFPGDPESGQIVVRDYSWAVGHTWAATSTIVNQFIVGVSRSGLLFPAPFQPAFPNTFGTESATGGTWVMGLSTPFADISEQDRFVTTPTIRDDVTWTKGTHTLAFGGVFKPIKSITGLTNDFNFVTLGLGGNLANLNVPAGTPSLRPATLGTGATRIGNYDAAFAFLLGRVGQVATNFVNDATFTPQPPGTGKTRDYRYNEYELYFQDNWRATPSLTLTAGVRYQYYSPPYEADGFQACNDVDYEQLVSIRLQNAGRGISGASSEPFLRYDLCGKANNARGMFEPDLNNFAPRLSFAWNPSFKDGILGKILGDRKTVIRGGGNVQFDRIAGSVQFIADQLSYLYDNSATTSFGTTNARTSLLNDPRFAGPLNLPVQNTAPAVTRPFTPYVDAGFPFGNAIAGENYTVAQNFKVPYSIQYSFGFQRELPGNFVLDMSYVGRQGRQLFSQADASQVLNFRDPASGQFLFAAYNAVAAQLLAGVAPGAVALQPFFENQIGAGGTRFLANNFSTELLRGDLNSAIFLLYANGLLDPNVGMNSQFSTNAYITNLGSSTYNGMLVSLRKRFSQGLQFDLNYTWSHAIDNQSSIANTVFGGLVCDITNLRVCRGNADFDIRHLLNANFIYELPFGRGRTFGTDSGGLMNAIIGDWTVSGIVTARSGLPFNFTTSSFPTSFRINSPAVIIGGTQALQGNIITTANGQVQFFGNTTQAEIFNAANPLAGLVRNPVGGEIGNRNVLRGPGYWNVDIAILKNFRMPWSENHRLQLRAEMYNAFNHNSFGLPSANINATSFGIITTSSSAAREMQFAIRYEF